MKLKNPLEWLLDKISDGLSTKTCYVLLCIIAFGTLAFQRSHDILGWQNWLSQVFMQFIALNVVVVVSTRVGEKLEKLILAIYEWTKFDNAMIREELKLAREEREELKQLIAEVHKQTRGDNYIGL